MRGGWGQFFFNKNFLYLLWALSWDMWGLVWSVWRGGRGRGLSDASILGIDRMVCSWSGFVWLAFSFRGLPSGQSSISGAWPWIGLGGPGEGLGASLMVIIALILCNYIKFQNYR